MGIILPNFVYALILTRSRLGMLPVIFSKGVRALRGSFGPLKSKKLKVAFHQFHLIGLLEE